MDFTGGLTFTGGLSVTKEPPSIINYLASSLSSSGATLSYFQSMCSDSTGNSYYLCLGTTPASIIAYKCNSSGVVQWATTIACAPDTSSYQGLGVGGITVDSSGNVYFIKNASVAKNMVIVKCNSSGTVQWQRTLGDGTNQALGCGIAVDSSGNVYITGAVSTSLILAKFDSSGTLLWQRQIAAGTNTIYNRGLNSVVIDSAGNVYAGGQVNSSYDRALLVKYNSSGTIQWQTQLSTTQNTNVFQSLHMDSTNSYIYCVGQASNSQSNDMMVAKYNTSGTFQWARKLGATNVTDVGARGAVDSSDNVYLAGYYTSGNDYQAVYKVDSSGSLVWSRTVAKTGATYTRGQGIAAGPNNTFYLVTEDVFNPNPAISWRLPNDGTMTGSYTVGASTFTYSTYSGSIVTFTGTIASSQSESAASLTAATSSYTVSTSTITATVTTIATT
jgi:hypothetical protein